MTQTIDEILRNAFSLLSRAAARKKVYLQKALQEGRHDVSHLLRAISESELVQARRLFNSLRGKIDVSENYVETIFEEEIKETIEHYSHYLEVAQREENKSLIQVLTQLRAAERRIMAFYSNEKKDIENKGEQKYFVCQFCGYVQTENLPETCPICGAQKTGFLEAH